jgi:asparagine synthase (glutamine-hydrolysing)|tara:strand:- start:3560 stop:5500 length:1941 start_codon:yes stop_codon:yes gene_type:complete
MCGLAGFILNRTSPSDNLDWINNKMIETIAHRGPDDLGAWSNSIQGIGLSHCRLAIQDLTAAGHQPMHSTSGRFVLVFNGEIYNHLEIRQQLQSINSTISWKGHSDTETLLSSIEVLGLEETLRIAVGMFAFALWDNTRQQIILARDRFGEKPLYYGFSNKNFIFGSELKALKAFPGFDNDICRRALSKFIKLNYVPAPMSIYQNIFKLEPGMYLQLDSKSIGEQKPKIIQYWSYEEKMKKSLNNLYQSKEEAFDSIALSLDRAIKSQMISDVPLGAFLSGGVDSSLVVANMQKHSMSKIKTYTIGFENKDYDESAHAQKVSEHLGTEHFTLHVSAHDALEIIPSLPEIYDEPFADSSQIPTYFVCKSAKQSVTVALSGDAGDELFGGYNRYIWGPKVWNAAKFLPPSLRNLAAQSLQVFSPNILNTGLSFLNISRPGDKIHKLSQALTETNSMNDFYSNLVSEWNTFEPLIKNDSDNNFNFEDKFLDGLDGLSSAEQMMLIDAQTYLPDDILCKVDRASMAMSLETRAPFLDYRLAESAWRVPQSMKIKGNDSKWILRELLYKHVPRHLIERPKTGFSIPLGEWLRGPLRDWAEELIDFKRLENDGYFYPEPIRNAWSQHLAKTNDHSAKLWSILMFQSWLDSSN